ncbi:MAG: putative pyridoxal phosphate-dependent enzyme [Cellvibrionaceae bacterium]|jgi:uncharacterized pyridoxal phosphate-dependent enzyme
MTNYESLGIRPIINAYATLTRLGGSIMRPEVVQAMSEASKCFVDLEELQLKVGAKIAELTQNKAATITSGAAAGIKLAAAACVTIHDQKSSPQFPVSDQLKNEIIVHKAHRNGFDYGIEELGLKLIEIGDSNGTSLDDLRRAISKRSAAIFWFQGVMTSDADVPLPDLIKIANEYDIPVIVDAAAQLPPVENLWRYTQMGAALAIFSGGKDLRGPQSSGLILGRTDLIEEIRSQSNPNYGIGRTMKVGKEEIMGLLVAVECYLKIDHDARQQHCEEIVKNWCESINQVEGLKAERDFPNEAGQPLPWCLVTINREKCPISRDEMVQNLLDGDPAVAVSPYGESQFHLNPTTLQPGEEIIVLERLIESCR